MNTFGPTGLLSRKDAQGEVFYLFNPFGNVALRMAANGLTVQSSDRYDAWGNLETGGDEDDPFGYRGQTGYYTDHEIGFILCRHRYHDPVNGRWLTRDPIGFTGGINLYSYCNGNPVMWIDPTGLASSPLPGADPWGRPIAPGIEPHFHPADEWHSNDHWDYKFPDPSNGQHLRKDGTVEYRWDPENGWQEKAESKQTDQPI